MTTYSIKQLEDLAAGQGTGHDTYRNLCGFDTFRPPPAPRDVRRDIYNAVYSAGKAMSRADIANALGVKKSPWLIEHCERLVAEGYMVKVIGVAPNGVDSKFYYSVAE